MPECAFHQGVETNVSCTECGRYICPKDMVDTPVGYKCRECGDRRTPEARRGQAAAAASSAARPGSAAASCSGIVLSFVRSSGRSLSIVVRRRGRRGDATRCGRAPDVGVRRHRGRRRAFLGSAGPACSGGFNPLTLVMRPLAAGVYLASEPLVAARSCEDVRADGARSSGDDALIWSRCRAFSSRERMWRAGLKGLGRGRRWAPALRSVSAGLQVHQDNGLDMFKTTRRDRARDRLPDLACRTGRARRSPEAARSSRRRRRRSSASRPNVQSLLHTGVTRARRPGAGLPSRQVTPTSRAAAPGSSAPATTGSAGVVVGRRPDAAGLVAEARRARSLRDEPRQLGVAVRVRVVPGARVVAQREADVEPVLRARAGDVEEAPLLLDLLDASRSPCPTGCCRRRRGSRRPRPTRAPWPSASSTG